MSTKRLEEKLILDLTQNIYVSGKLTQFLTTFQWDGIRYLYFNYKKVKSKFYFGKIKFPPKKKSGFDFYFSSLFHFLLVQGKSCILNDESGLGKTFQIIAFLTSIADGILKCLVVCKDPEKVLKWLYHLNRISNFELSFVDACKKISVISVDDLKDYTTVWDYVVLDEGSEMVFSEKNIEEIKKIKCKLKLFVTSIDVTVSLNFLICGFALTFE